MEGLTLVIVKWRDAVRHPQHVFLAEVEELHSITVESAGFLYSHDQDELKLVNSIFDEDQTKDTLVIPSSWVLSVRPLTLAAPGDSSAADIDVATRQVVTDAWFVEPGEEDDNEIRIQENEI